MARKLPWSRQADTPVKQEPIVSPSPAPSAALSHRDTPLGSSTRATPSKPEITPTPVQHKLKYRAERSPSTSPPPEPLEETPMQEGLEYDDQYRMVEDEFLDIAGQFTAHLHRAEYLRLKTQAKSQNADAIDSISRPVVGSLTDLARRRQEEVLRKKKQRQALRRAQFNAGEAEDGSGGENDIPWKGTALQGLMDSPRKNQAPLMSLMKSSSSGGNSLRGAATSSRTPSDGRTQAPLARKQPSRSHSTSTPMRQAGSTGQVRSDDSIEKTLRAPTSAGSSRSGPASTNSPSYSKTPIPTRAHQTTPANASRTAMQSSSAQSNRHSTPASDSNSDDDIFTSFKKRKLRDKPSSRHNVKKRDAQPAGASAKDSNKDQDIIPLFV